MRPIFAVHRLRHASTLPPARTLTTVPRKLPSHASTWSPASRIEFLQESNPIFIDAPHTTHDVAPAISQSSTLPKNARKDIVFDVQVGRNTARQRLQQCLQLLKGPTTDTVLRRFLWRAYGLAKRTDSNLLKDLPRRAWNILWKSQSVFYRRDRYARAHVLELYEDMLDVGVPASVDQKIAYLDSMFLNGQQQQALEEWDTDYTEMLVGKALGLEPEYLEWGVRMYGLAGYPERAHEIMDKLFAHHPTWDADVLKAVFRAYTQSKSSESLRIAREIYGRAREHIPNGANITDYDCFFVGFLEAGSLKYAQQVFGDMVVKTHSVSDRSESTIEQVLRRLRMLYGLVDDIPKATDVFLQAISTLGGAYHPHIYGMYMGLDVVRQSPEATAQIMESMFDRGVNPETFHFNLLLKSLFRSEEKVDILKAENVGWQMMHEATKGLPVRSPSKSAANAIARSEPSKQSSSGGTSLPRKVPPANATTIALLMRHHSNSSGWEHVQYLEKQLKVLNLPANEEIMNVLMDEACSKGKHNRVWNIYCRLTNPPDGSSGVFPNGASFRHLWKTMRLAYADPSTSEKSTLPSPRALLAEQIRWWSLIRSRPDSERFKIGLSASDRGAIYKLMIHCFSYDGDLPGSLVAIHVMKQLFGILPSQNAAEILQKQIAWADMHGFMTSARKQHSHSVVPKKIIAQMAQIFRILEDNRLASMDMTDDDYARLSPEEVGNIQIDIMSEFVRVILKRHHGAEHVEEMIDAAKKDIGVPDLQTGDRDAFHVL